MNPSVSPSELRRRSNLQAAGTPPTLLAVESNHWPQIYQSCAKGWSGDWYTF